MRRTHRWIPRRLSRESRIPARKPIHQPRKGRVWRWMNDSWRKLPVNYTGTPRRFFPPPPYLITRNVSKNVFFSHFKQTIHARRHYFCGCGERVRHGGCGWGWPRPCVVVGGLLSTMNKRPESTLKWKKKTRHLGSNQLTSPRGAVESEWTRRKNMRNQFTSLRRAGCGQLEQDDRDDGILYHHISHSTGDYRFFSHPFPRWKIVWVCLFYLTYL